MSTTESFSASRTLEPLMDELTLVRLSQQGDREMFAHLYDTYVERIYRYIYFRVADDMMAEDITSQVFLKVWEKLGSYQAGQSPFMAWLYRIAHNTVIDYYRKKKVTTSLEEVEEINTIRFSHTDQVDEKLDLQVQSRQLREALQELTEKQRQVLILKFVGGLSTTEIAQQLGQRQGAVRALQMRGLQELAKCPTIQREQVYA